MAEADARAVSTGRTFPRAVLVGARSNHYWRLCPWLFAKRNGGRGGSLRLPLSPPCDSGQSCADIWSPREQRVTGKDVRPVKRPRSLQVITGRASPNTVTTNTATGLLTSFLSSARCQSEAVRRTGVGRFLSRGWRTSALHMSTSRWRSTHHAQRHA